MENTGTMIRFMPFIAMAREGAYDYQNLVLPEDQAQAAPWLG
jgi:hypothetical protein